MSDKPIPAGVNESTHAAAAHEATQHMLREVSSQCEPSTLRKALTYTGYVALETTIAGGLGYGVAGPIGAAVMGPIGASAGAVDAAERLDERRSDCMTKYLQNSDADTNRKR